MIIQDKKVNVYQIWVEGFIITGAQACARQLIHEDGTDLWSGETFQIACEKALVACEHELSLYDKRKNTYWGCRLFDNELEARKSFG